MKITKESVTIKGNIKLLFKYFPVDKDNLEELLKLNEEEQNYESCAIIRDKLKSLKK